MIAILDIDGTLVDTNYQHTLAWFRAFARHGIILPIWQIHRRIGMGGDQVVESLCDRSTEERLGDEIRDAERQAYARLIGEVHAVSGARELVEELKDLGHTVVLASSAGSDEVDHYLGLLDLRELADGWTTSADVRSTKPEPDLVRAALERAGGHDAGAVMIGDTPWDVEAALQADIDTLAVMTGGFSEHELREAGAIAVFESVSELRQSLPRTPLAAAAAGSRL